ncbi:MAG: AI-2E family transporter [Methylacidiphilales bacterium]|nr:AI-2E family transporter [Candidatus Methylacidiphilales bacterium]
MTGAKQTPEERQTGSTDVPANTVSANRFVSFLFAAFLVSAILYLARVVIEPVAFALFGIALVWPALQALERRVPRPLALLLTILLAMVVIFAMASAIIWSVSDIVHWVLDNIGQFHLVYTQVTQWLESHGVFVADGFNQYDLRNFAWFLQNIVLHVNALAGFGIVVFLLMTFGLTEMSYSGDRFQELTQRTGWQVAATSLDIAKKIRTYMLIRTLASLATGVAVFLYTKYIGLDLAIAWGVISFILNYIPYIGTLVAVILPVMFSAIQFESWQMPLILFGGLYLVQFFVGSYLEPIAASKALSVSPFVMLVAFFFWGFLWGLPGAFIGLPMTIALVTACQHNPSTQWIVRLLSSPK